MARKRIVRPNLGGVLRPRAKTPRSNFLYIEVTEAERLAILDHCVKIRKSLSHFLAEVLLEDAGKPKRTDKIVLRAQLGFTPAEYEKLELLAMLYGKNSLDELIRDLIQPVLDTQNIHTDRQTSFVRFYLSQEEHQSITSHIAAKNIPIGKYAAMLALKTIAKEQPRRK